MFVDGLPIELLSYTPITKSIKSFLSVLLLPNDHVSALYILLALILSWAPSFSKGVALPILYFPEKGSDLFPLLLGLPKLILFSILYSE